MFRRGRALFLGLLVTVPALAGIRSETPVPAFDDPQIWWVKRHSEKCAQAAKEQYDVLFVGDSAVQFFEIDGYPVWKELFSESPYKALNLGFVHDRTEHVLWRLRNGETTGQNPKSIVLQLGTNNGTVPPFDSVGDTVLGVRAVVNELRRLHPDARIVLCAISPRGFSADDPMRRHVRLVNREIARFADGRHVVWFNVSPLWLNADGTLPAGLIRGGGVFPSTDAYRLWAHGLLPWLALPLPKDTDPIPMDLVRVIGPSEQPLRDADIPVFPVSRIRTEGYGAFDWWLDRFRRNRERIFTSGGKFDLIFFGDSITHNWENQGKVALADLEKTYSILNLGYSGDNTQHLLWRGEHGELDGYSAKAIMLMIGTNNTRDSAEDTARGVKAVIDLCRRKQGEAKIILLPIFPCGESPTDSRRVKNEKTNAIIRGFCDGKFVLWCDFNARFLTSDGRVTKEVMPDFLHPSSAYYPVWSNAVRPIFKKICGK